MEKKTIKLSPASRIHNFRYALKGIKKVFHDEVNFRIHLIISIIIIVLAFSFKINILEWTLVIVCIGLVFTAEIINTAIENLVDWISPHYHDKAGDVKDISAAAVLVSSIAAFVTGLIIFLPYIVRLCKQLFS